jgi:putative DNA primase/helicase
MQNWLLRLRRKGMAVLIIHHAGVNGKQRGTSRREDALDTVIALRRPDDYSPLDGARFEVHFEKLRHRVADGAAPFEALVESFDLTTGGYGIRWLARDLQPPVLHRAAELFARGLTVRQVAAILELSRSEAGRLRLKAVAEGLLEAGGEEDDGETNLEGTHSLN